MLKLLLKFTVGLHLLSVWSGAIIGGYEQYTFSPKYFSTYGDDLYTASARGFIRGAYYPYNTLLHVPKVWLEEKPTWL
jgi:hypothetical protein